MKIEQRRRQGGGRQTQSSSLSRLPQFSLQTDATNGFCGCPDDQTAALLHDVVVGVVAVVVGPDTCVVALHDDDDDDAVPCSVCRSTVRTRVSVRAGLSAFGSGHSVCRSRHRDKKLSR